ncbi:MAG: PAS domain S-box protein [Devosia sp.]
MNEQAPLGRAAARLPDFKALFESTPNLYLVLDPRLQIVAVNDAYCAATMTVREQIVGRGLFEVFPDNPDDPQATGASNLRASLQRVLSQHKPDRMPQQKYDIARPAAEGGGFEVRYWSPLNAPVLDLAGRLLWIIHRVEDVTEFARLEAEGRLSERTISQLREANQSLADRNAENLALQRDLEAQTIALRETTAFFDTVIENIPAMIAVKDAADLRFVLFNRAGEQLTGISREELLGRNDFDVFPRAEAEHFTARDREVLEAGKLQVIDEETISTRSGDKRYLTTHKVPVRDEKGVPKYLMAMSTDITEQKRGASRLQASEAMTGSLMAANPDAVIAVNGNGHIVHANERVRATHGYAPAELIGRHASILIPPASVEADMDRIRKALAGPSDNGARIIHDLEGLRQDGTTFPTEVSVSEHQTDSGRVIVLAIRDVTARRAVEGQLRQAMKMEAIGNLTGGLAHDFNNLLSIVIGNLDLLREQLTRGDGRDELAGEALSAALRGAELTRRLLAFARRQPLQPKVVDVVDLVRGVSRLLGRTLGENVQIDFRPLESTWPVTVDPVQLEACLMNLATNARDAMPGGGRVEISTDNRHLDVDYAGLHPGLEPGDFTLIQVTDSGTGIPREVMDKIFEPFFTTKQEGRGTGLGLSMVFGFMKQSGGHINVYSEEGVGTTFRLYLPRAQQALDSTAIPDTGFALGGAETILAVEDNPGLRDLVVRQLKQLGYRCFEAADGPSAVAILETQRIDLLFSDVIMPGGMSGYELGRLARTRWPHIRVLLTSGFPEEKLNGNGGPPWNMRLLIKPYRKEDLALALREVLAG